MWFSTNNNNSNINLDSPRSLDHSVVCSCCSSSFRLLCEQFPVFFRFSLSLSFYFVWHFCTPNPTAAVRTTVAEHGSATWQSSSLLLILFWFFSSILSLVRSRRDHGMYDKFGRKRGRRAVQKNRQVAPTWRREGC